MKHSNNATSNASAHQPKHMRSAQAEPANSATTAATRSDIGRSTRMMSVLVILSRLTGFLRTWAQAFAVGATIISSCYTLSNNLLTQLYGLVAGGLIVTGFMPVYVQARKRGGQENGNDYVSNLLSIVGLALAVIVALSIIFAPQLV